MANRVDAPRHVMDHEYPDKSAPQQTLQESRPGLGDAHGDQRGQEQPQRNPEKIKPVDKGDVPVAEEVGNQTAVILRSVVEHPAGMGVPPTPQARRQAAPVGVR